MKRLVLVGVILFFAGCQKQATFDGRPASYWFEELNNPQPMARMRAAQAMPRLGAQGKRSIPILIRFLDDKQHLIRWSAAVALGEFGADARDALAALDNLAEKDPEPSVRFAAEQAAKLIRRGIQEEAGGGS